MRDRIAASPSILGLGDEPKAVATEVRVPAVGPADVVVVDAKGQVTIVECKREKNPEIRRSVIGQVFAYAAGSWKLDYKEFAWRLAERGASLTDPFEDDPNWDRARFRDQVTQNLRDGAFELIIAVDQLPPELKRTVAFLHGLVQPKVRLKALAIRMAEDGIQAELYDPEEVGPPQVGESKARIRLLAAILERSGEAAADAASEMLIWAKCQPELKVRITDGYATVKAPSGRRFKIEDYRTIRVSLGSLAHRDDWDDERIKDYVRELRDIGVPMDGGRPRASLESFADAAKRTAFLALIGREIEVPPG